MLWANGFPFLPIYLFLVEREKDVLKFWALINPIFKNRKNDIDKYKVNIYGTRNSLNINYLSGKKINKKFEQKAGARGFIILTKNKVIQIQITEFIG